MPLVVLLMVMLGALTSKAQVDFKLYLANNVGDVNKLSKITDAGSGLKWNEVSDGNLVINSHDADAVKAMFADYTRQKTRKDQELFWKMRDDNLLCFRINDGSGKHGEFVAKVKSCDKEGGELERIVTSYFFINPKNESDSLIIKVCRKGNKGAPGDTLRLRYSIKGWANNDLLLFKLDSRRRSSGLTYQLECVAQPIGTSEKRTTTLELSGSNFQSYYKPDLCNVDFYLVSNGTRLKLDNRRLVWGANLSDKLGKLTLSSNFILDKHKNRELTFFNMLGSGLFEKYDTLYLDIRGDKGMPIPCTFNSKNDVPDGFDFHIVQVDANGKYVKSDVQMKYAGYNSKEKKHKILTYGLPCYIEVFAPGHYPAVFKYPGAMDPSTKVLNADHTFGTLRMMKGTATSAGPDISSQSMFALKDLGKEDIYDGKVHKVFSIENHDLNKLPTEGYYLFLEDGGYQQTPKLLDGKPVTKYVEMAIEYSQPKSSSASSSAVTLQFEEKGSTDSPLSVNSTNSTVLNGNDYPGFSRSYYTVRWDLVGKLSKTNADYKPRLKIGTKAFNDIPFLRPAYIDEAASKENAKVMAQEFAFKKPIDGEWNGMGALSVLGELGKWNFVPNQFPGLNLSVTPFFDPVKGVFEFDVNFSMATSQSDMNGNTGNGNKWRKNFTDHKQSDRIKLNEVGGLNNALEQLGVSVKQNASTAKVDKDHWFQAEMDDIFKVEVNKLGYGPFIDAHFGIGYKFNYNVKADSESGFYLKGLDAHAGFGFFFSKYWNPFERITRNWKFLRFTSYINAVAQFRVGLGLKSYSFKTNGVISHRRYGFFVEGMLQGKVGGGLQLNTDFSKDEQQPGNNEGNIEGDNEGDNEGNIEGGDNGGNVDDSVDSSGGDNAANSRAMALRRAATKGQWANRFFSCAVGGRAGGKVQLNGAIVNMEGKEGWDMGASFMFLVGAEAYLDLKIGPFIRINPRVGLRYTYFKAWPDNENNPTIPAYPNYHPSLSSSRLVSRRASDVPAFPIGNCILDGLNFKASPYYLGFDNFVIQDHGDGTDLNQAVMTEYDIPAIGKRLDKDYADTLSTPGRYVQHHFATKESNTELVVYEEMNREISNDLLKSDPSVEKEMEETRQMKIVADLRSEFTPNRKHLTVAYDPDLIDSNPVAAINTWTEDGRTSVLGMEDIAACVWKRGQYLLPPYDEDGATEEQQQNKADAEASGLLAFEGDLMLSVLEDGKWSAPESILKLTTDDILSDYQVLMRNDSVLVALTVLPKDKDSLELRYYSKPATEPIRYVGKDLVNPVHFSLEQVGAMPTIAILNQKDSVNKDIYVKEIDMMGRYQGYGSELAISRYSPQSVKIIVDKTNERPEDFAVVWNCVDRLIRRGDNSIATDSTQTMLNCSRIFMCENMTATPHITLASTADSTYLSGYDVLLDERQVSVLYTLTDARNGNTYLMTDSLKFTDDFRYTIGYDQESMIYNNVVPVNITVYNTGSTPIDMVEGFINDEEFLFDDVFINPFSSQTLTFEYEMPENYNGLLRAHDVVAFFTDSYAISKASRRGAPVRRRVASSDTVTEYASGTSDLGCELLSQSIEGTKNTVCLELTDYDGLNENETVHVGLYTSHTTDVPLCSSAEVLLKAGDFSEIGGFRKAYVELTVDGLEEEQEVEIRARVYNDRVLDALGDDDDVSEAIVDNLSWRDNQRIITLYPVELDHVTLLPVVKMDEKQRKVRVEQTDQGVWVSGLEGGDFLRIFDAEGLPVYQQSHPSSRLFVPLRERGVYLLSAGQEVVKFRF